MPRPAVLRDPVRLHLLLEKKTVIKLRELAKKKARPLGEMIRELAESYANGHVIVREPSLSNVIARIREFRGAMPPSPTKSETIIRHWRDKRA